MRTPIRGERSAGGQVRLDPIGDAIPALVHRGPDEQCPKAFPVSLDLAETHPIKPDLGHGHAITFKPERSRNEDRRWLAAAERLGSVSRSIPTSTARSVRSSPQSINRSAKARLWVAPEFADPVGPVEVGEHEYVEQLGTGSAAEGVQALLQSALELDSPNVRLSSPLVNRPSPPAAPRLRARPTDA